MATVTDTATGAKYEGVYGNLLTYYVAEGSRFKIEYDEGEARPESAPEVDQVEQVSQDAGDDDQGQGQHAAVEPFVLPEGGYLASDGVVYDKADQRVDPQPTPEQLALLQH